MRGMSTPHKNPRHCRPSGTCSIWHKDCLQTNNTVPSLILMPRAAACTEAAMTAGAAKENKTIGCRTGSVPVGFRGLFSPGRPC